MRRHKEKSRKSSYSSYSIHFIIRTSAGVYVLGLSFRNSNAYDAFVITNTGSQTKVMW